MVQRMKDLTASLQWLGSCCVKGAVFTVAVLGVTVTLLTVKFRVVKRIALLNGLIVNVFETG